MQLSWIFLLSIGAAAALGCGASGTGEVAGGLGTADADAGVGGSVGSPSASTGGGTASGGPPSGGGSSSGGGPSGGGGSSSGGGPLPGRDGGSVTVSPDGSAVVTGSSPNIGGCNILPPDSAWNTRIDDPLIYPVHPNAAAYAANMNPTRALHADWGNWSTDKYGIPWQVVPSTQPEVPISFTAGSAESDPGPYPIPASAKVEGGASAVGGDQHVLALQAGTCMLYELYQGTFTGPGWSCTSAAKFDLGTNALRPAGWTSTDAAGLPIFPGLVKLAEVQAGAIKHALRFTVGKTQQGYIHPATHAAGSADPSLPPMGLRVRLKASFDTSPFSGPALVIITAMKQYGLILADNGSSWYVTGDSDDGWTPLMGEIASGIGSIHGSDFEAVLTGPIETSGL